MNATQQTLFFFSALGAFNGFVLSIYLLFFKKSKSPASYFLGLLLLALSIRIGKAILTYFYPGLPKIYLQIGLSGCFFIGPSLFYFTKAALNNIQVTPKSWKYTYSFFLAFIVGIGVVLPYQTHPWDWNHYIVHIIYTQWTVYFLLTAWTIRPTLVKLLSRNEKLSANEKPVLSIFLGNAIILTAYLIVFLTSAFGFVYISGALFFSLLLYLNVPLFLTQKKSNASFLGLTEQQPYANKKITDERADRLITKLQQLILTEEPYKNADLKLNDLAKKINVSAHELSQLLNDNLGKSFATYINQYRIDEACKIIATNTAIKLEEIGYEVGFNSKSTFYTAFKKHKGCTPTIYKEQLESSPTDSSANL